MADNNPYPNLATCTNAAAVTARSTKVGMCTGASRVSGMRNDDGKLVRHGRANDETVILAEFDGILDDVGRGRAGAATYA